MSKFDIEYYYNFYEDLVSSSTSFITEFFSHLREKSIDCLYAIQGSYSLNIEHYDNVIFRYSDFNWHTAFYLKRKFYTMKENFEKFKVRVY